MRRRALFEFNELSWWPSLWKNMEMDYLSTANEFLGLYRPAIDRFGRILNRLKCDRVVDLCSGGGRHWGAVLRQLERKHGRRVHVRLSDIRPHSEAYRAAGKRNRRIGFIETPVDATCLPPGLVGFRTMFAGLHHFKPDQARSILRDAAERREGIAVFEHTHRSLTGILCMLFAPLFVWALTPFTGPVTTARLFWTYLVPIIPLTILWDGLVSAARSYTVEELDALTRTIDTAAYRWHMETFRVCGLLTTTLLIGYPLGSSRETRVRQKSHEFEPNHVSFFCASAEGSVCTSGGWVQREKSTCARSNDL